MSGNNCDYVRPQQTRIIKPTRRSNSGVFPFRSEMPIPYESSLERDFLIRTEHFNCVFEIVPQPVKIPFIGMDGRQYTYTPDFLVYYKLGNHSPLDPPKPLLVEVKPEEDWRRHWREWLPKWKAARRLASERGWVFHINDESRIRDKAFENIQFLARYKRLEFAPEDIRAVLDSVREVGCPPIQYLLERHFMGAYRGVGISMLWHMIATRLLECDISQPLSDLIEVWVSDDE